MASGRAMPSPSSASRSCSERWGSRRAICPRAARRRSILSWHSVTTDPGVNLAMKKENIENIYRLSPIQQGMLFHTLYAPGEGVYFEQFNLVFGERFDPLVFERLWKELI